MRPRLQFGDAEQGIECRQQPIGFIDRSADCLALGRTRAWIGCAAGFGALALLQTWPVFRLFSNTRSANGLDYSLSLVGSVSSISAAGALVTLPAPLATVTEY